jgi:hypothetical protein
MADSALNIDWLASASSTASTCKLNVYANVQTANDSLAAAATNQLSCWINDTVGDLSKNTTKWSAGATYYKMRGMDQTTNGLYATWVVTGAPDYSAGSYTGALNRPLRDVHVVDTWTV